MILISRIEFLYSRYDIIKKNGRIRRAVNQIIEAQLNDDVIEMLILDHMLLMLILITSFILAYIVSILYCFD